MSVTRNLRLAAVLSVSVVAGSGCETLMDVESQQTITADHVEAMLADGIVFLSLNFEPNAWMDALYRGVVTTDAAGCIRLATEDAHTVVWPKGYHFEAASGGIRILTGDGRLVGRLGGEFHFGGGEVPDLHEGLGFTQPDRELIAQLCPGRFWIASP